MINVCQQTAVYLRDAIFDVEEINKRWLDLAAVDVWSQLIIKETADSVECIERAPRTGQWVLDDDGGLRFQRAALDWHQLQDPNEFFFLRVCSTCRTWAGSASPSATTRGSRRCPVSWPGWAPR
jgi:hypothetical protein